MRKTKEPQTYKQALKTPSRLVWPGCGDGRKRWCGSVHDFNYTLSNGDLVHNFECRHNHFRGCPIPIPEPNFDEDGRMKDD